MEFGLEKDTIEKIKLSLRKYPEIRKVIIYGSRAMGNYKRGSDIDFAIVGNLEWDFIGKLAEELNSIPCPYTFDLTDYSRITNPDLKKHIDTKGKDFYSYT